MYIKSEACDFCSVLLKSKRAVETVSLVGFYSQMRPAGHKHSIHTIFSPYATIFSAHQSHNYHSTSFYIFVTQLDYLYFRGLDYFLFVQSTLYRCIQYRVAAPEHRLTGTELKIIQFPYNLLYSFSYCCVCSCLCNSYILRCSGLCV